MTPEKIDAMAREYLRLLTAKADTLAYLKSVINKHGRGCAQKVVDRIGWIIAHE